MRILWWWLRVVTLLLTAAAASGFNPAHAARPVVLVLGDSLSAGYGLPSGTGWVDLLERKLAAESPDTLVVNASISGETTFGGMARLPLLLDRHRPAVVVVELGANDALRGTDLELTRSNLKRIVVRSNEAGARTLVVGMRIPSNYGPQYTESFFRLFGEVARDTRSAYVPFLFEGFAERRDMFQEDGLHPGRGAQAAMLANVWPKLSALLKAPARPRKP